MVLSLNNTKILVVDDAPENRQIVELFLASVGAVVTGAVNGQDGIEKAISDHYDLILMDLEMPLVGGT